MVMGMGQTILSKGKNVREAIELGLELLGIGKEEASIEIIQKETKGFLQLRSRHAVVKLTKVKSIKNHREQASPSINISEIERVVDNFGVADTKADFVQINSSADENCLTEELKGKVWVKEGQIYCQPSDLHFPTISVGRGIKLLKNNDHIAVSTIATQEDQFEIQTEEETKETIWNITMDSQKLNVYLHVEPGMRKISELKDIGPDFHIILEAVDTVDIVNDLEYKQILETLNELRVTHGLSHSEIMRAVNTDTPARFTIASGVKPKEGKNGRIELFVETEKKMGLKERANGTVDFRDVQVIPTVQKGQVVAKIHHPVPGIPGYTVTNEPIPPKQTYPLIVQCGKGITLLESQNKLVATEKGRPFIEQKGLMTKVSIVEKLIHRGDVNISSGNIRFNGDIDVLGNVEDGMVVKAEENIAIFKNVYSASISSNKSVRIRGNSIGSTISAGKQNIFSSQMVYLLRNIQEDMKKMILTIKQLMNLPALKMTDYSIKGLLPLIKILLEKKFKLLSTRVRQFITFSKKGSHLLDHEWQVIAEQLRLCFFSTVMNEYHSFDSMMTLERKLGEMIEQYVENQDMECSVELSYALNSHIYSGGDVRIKGQGCYNSKIHAGGVVVINGVFRGGEIYSGQGVTIRESGSEGGVTNKIIVPSDGKIRMDLAREGTVIQIGKVKHTFQEEHRNIIARLDEHERLVFKH